MEPVSTFTLSEVANRCAVFDEFSFVPVEINNYTDHVDIDFQIMQFSEDGQHFVEEEKVSLPFFENDRFLPLFMRGYSFVWDRVDMMFRWVPEKPAVKSAEISPYIKFFDNGELRIDREYALRNLSPEALRYSFERNEEYIAWNTNDYSHIPVMFEIPAAFDYMKDYEGDHILKPDYFNVIVKLRYYFCSYCADRGLENINYTALFEQNHARKLRTPDDPALDGSETREIGGGSNG